MAPFRGALRGHIPAIRDEGASEADPQLRVWPNASCNYVTPPSREEKHSRGRVLHSVYGCPTHWGLLLYLKSMLYLTNANAHAPETVTGA